MSVAAMEVHQPELFDGAWPVDPVLEKRAKEFLHTGKIACRDAERVERVVRSVLLRIPARKIARMERIGRETIDAIVAHAHETGKLRPIQEALLTEAVEIAMLAGHALKEALADGKVQPQCLGMVWGTATDKIQLLTHQATSIVVHKDGGDAERLIRAAWAAMQRAQEAAVECGADAIDAQVLDVQQASSGALANDAAFDAGAGAGGPQEGPAVEPGGTAASPSGGEGGGGVMPNAPPPDTQWSSP